MFTRNDVYKTRRRESREGYAHPRDAVIVINDVRAARNNRVWLMKSPGKRIGAMRAIEKVLLFIGMNVVVARCYCNILPAIRSAVRVNSWLRIGRRLRPAGLGGKTRRYGRGNETR